MKNIKANTSELGVGAEMGLAESEDTNWSCEGGVNGEARTLCICTRLATTVFARQSILASMADPEKLATLSAITGADDNAAHMILNSFNGDLERAVDYVMENGEQGVAALSAFTPVSDAAQALEASDEEPIDLSSPSPMAQAAARHAAEVQLRNRGWQEEEAALQQALAASKMTAGAGAASSQMQLVPLGNLLFDVCSFGSDVDGAFGK